MTPAASFLYDAYGIVLELPFACAALPSAAAATAEIRLEFAPVPTRLGDGAVRDAFWEAEPTRALFSLGTAGRLLVEGGHRIVADRLADASDAVLAAAVVEFALPALLHQRGHLVLHASTAVIAGRAVLVCGPSGAGKSTTVAALMAEGVPVLADDVTVLRRQGDGEVVVLPGSRQLQLRRDARERLFPSLPDQAPTLKSAIELRHHPIRDAVRLGTIVALDRHQQDTLALVNVRGAAKFDLLQSCIFGPLPRTAHAAIFPLAAAAAAAADVYRLLRPEQRWTAADVARVIVERAACRHEAFGNDDSDDRLLRTRA